MTRCRIGGFLTDLKPEDYVTDKALIAQVSLVGIMAEGETYIAPWRYELLAVALWVTRQGK